MHFITVLWYITLVVLNMVNKNKQINKTKTHKTKKTCGTILSMKEQAIY